MLIVSSTMNFFSASCKIFFFLRSSFDERIRQEDTPVSSCETAERRKIALVIGNNEYRTDRLLYCVNDAIDLSNELKKIRFHVRTAINLNYASMREEIRKFITSIRKNDIVLFYFSMVIVYN